MKAAKPGGPPKRPSTGRSLKEALAGEAAEAEPVTALEIATRGGP